MVKKKTPALSRGCLFAWISVGICALLIVGLFSVIIARPATAAQGADVLRAIIGDEAVSKLEMVVFQVQDTVKQWKYDLGWATPAAPWQASDPISPRPLPTVISSAPSSTPDLAGKAPTPASKESVPAAITPAQLTWMPAPAIPFGKLSGEGIWTPYIQDARGQTVSYRTFLQPDPTRPYVIVGVVAFEVSQTRLHYVLGSVEPFAPDNPKRSGEMSAADKTPGVLLAMFNGGFKARHGHFGAMADGVIALPPRDGFGTLVIYKDGTLKMGEWGTEITDSPDMVAWRQNGPFVIHQGQISPKISENSPLDWGYTVDDVSPTWRSGIGLSADGKTLYYLCGSSLSMEMLASSMQAAGISDGLQLDINTYWVHFVAVRANGNKLGLDALFPDMMNENIDRYLQPYTRDFFYVTGINH